MLRRSRGQAISTCETHASHTSKISHCAARDDRATPREHSCYPPRVGWPRSSVIQGWQPLHRLWSRQAKVGRAAGQVREPHGRSEMGGGRASETREMCAWRACDDDESTAKREGESQQKGIQKTVGHSPISGRASPHQSSTKLPFLTRWTRTAA